MLAHSSWWLQRGVYRPQGTHPQITQNSSKFSPRKLERKKGTPTSNEFSIIMVNYSVFSLNKKQNKTKKTQKGQQKQKHPEFSCHFTSHELAERNRVTWHVALPLRHLRPLCLPHAPGAEHGKTRKKTIEKTSLSLGGAPFSAVCNSAEAEGKKNHPTLISPFRKVFFFRKAR